MTHHSNLPLAAKGLTSYRYNNGVFGWIMIGATDHLDALVQARRSTGKVGEPHNLQVWSIEALEYVPAYEQSTDELLKELGL